MPETVFVLGGGANLGATQVGMLRALLERGIRPDAVVGCSVGAINGAVFACDPTADGVERLETLWRNLDGGTICPPGRLNALWLMTRRYRALENNDGLRRLLERHIGGARFEDCSVPLHVVATSMTSGGEHWFSTGPLVPPLLASAAIPAVFPPVIIDNEAFIDGAVVNNVPISQAYALGAKRVVVLHVGNFSRPRRPPRRPIEALIQSFSIARNHRFELESSRPPTGAQLLVLPAVDPGADLGYHDFSRAHVLIERAYRLAADFLSAESVPASGDQPTTGASAHNLSRS
ncbi:MAG: patatin-like phospholipase family protein [Actinobacteria bacterium]|nr:patatin-like phospholipase family protein [Actinomycetota bacterium]